MIEYKYIILKKAFENYQSQQKNVKTDPMKEFIQRENDWLDDYSLYMTIKEQQQNQSWSEWPQELKYRQKESLQQIRETQQDSIQYHIFLQYIFHQQWSQLTAYANKSNIKIIGDMSIYVEYDSVEVWANTELFQLDDKTLLPLVVSGKNR